MIFILGYFYLCVRVYVCVCVNELQQVFITAGESICMFVLHSV